VAARLDLDLPGPEITAQICDIPSVSGSERAIADAIEAALRPFQHLRVDRNGDTIVARTEVGRAIWCPFRPWMTLDQLNGLLAWADAADNVRHPPGR
jgi:hypothetical protein